MNRVDNESIQGPLRARREDITVGLQSRGITVIPRVASHESIQGPLRARREDVTVIILSLYVFKRAVYRMKRGLQSRGITVIPRVASHESIYYRRDSCDACNTSRP